MGVGSREWAGLVRWAAAVVCALTLAVGVVSGDRETMVIAGALLVANGLLRWRTGVVGTVVAGLLAADIAFWMLPAAITNLANGERVGAVLVPAALACTSVVLLVACGFALASHRRPVAAGRGPVILVGAGAAVLAVAVLVGLLGATDGPESGDVEIRAHDTAFEPDRLTVDAGPVAFYVTNDDLFWHTFTITGTDVDARLATRGHQRVVTDLEPGTYEFVCAIPGHESLGMTGTLEVR